MWRKNLLLWLLSLSAATIFYHILPLVLPAKGQGLLYYGFSLFLFFSAISVGAFLAWLNSKVVYFVISVLTGLLSIAVFFWPNPLFFLLVCGFSGLVISKEYERILNAEGNLLRQFALVYAGILCSIFPSVFQIQLPEIIFPALSAISFMVYGFLRFQEETPQNHTEQKRSEGSKAGLVALWLNLVLESLLIVCSLCLTASLGFLFTLSTPWMFVTIYLFVQAWYPSMLTRSRGIQTEFAIFRYFPFFLGLLMLLSGFTLTQLYVFLEGMAIPQKLYLLAMKQAYVKEIAFFSALLIFLSGFSMVRDILWKGDKAVSQINKP
ncbi:MAG: hypothetical protein LW630_01030 [Saprospiraceae bacterium]|nr:hypothetical protein [Saprospiraceae bacterium]